MSDLGNIALTRIDGSRDSLSAHQGKVLLVVNVASKCGLTPQYGGLEALYRRYRDQGFEVLGFPANDFMGQEPGTNEDIAAFCSASFDVTFPLFAKADVTGPARQPLYAALIEACPTRQGDADGWRKRLRDHGITPTEDPEVLWNFEKFLIARNGAVVGRFSPGIEPEDVNLVKAIEVELGKSG